MGDPTPDRGGVYPYSGIRRGHFLVISPDALNRSGTTVVVEIVDDTPPNDLRGLLAVQLTDADPLSGSWVLCWRVNWVRGERLDVAGGLGQVTATTLDRITAAVRAVTEP